MSSTEREALLAKVGIMWKHVLKAINRLHKLGVQFNESELSAKFPNGSP